MPRLDHYRFSETDVAKTFSNLGMWWDHLTSGIDATAARFAGNESSAEAVAALGLLWHAMRYAMESLRRALVNRAPRRAAEDRHGARRGVSVGTPVPA